MDEKLVQKLAEALYNRDFPFYSLDTQGTSTQFRYSEAAKQLIELLSRFGLKIIEEEKAEPA